MGFSTFSGPLRSGTNKDRPEDNTGLVVLAQQAVISFEDTTATELFRLPAGSLLLDVTFLVTEQFDAGTNNSITVRTKDASPVTLSSVVETGGTIDPGMAGTFANTADSRSLYANTGTKDLVVEGLYAGTGTAATTGSAIVTCLYVQRSPEGLTAPATA